MSANDDDRIMEDAVRIMGDTVGTPEGFTPNCCVLSWRLRLGYAELYATLAPNNINAVIARARGTQPARICAALPSGLTK